MRQGCHRPARRGPGLGTRPVPQFTNGETEVHSRAQKRLFSPPPFPVLACPTLAQALSPQAQIPKTPNHFHTPIHPTITPQGPRWTILLPGLQEGLTECSPWPGEDMLLSARPGL